ncbi:MAG: flagellar motor protein MotB [Candidatus Sericytochromatia bacterium]|nr:flagellar motor protein MotB [Candidatus Sericytochromatia bacterium]
MSASGQSRRMALILGQAADEDKHGSLWLITYADMMTLVLAFFVMLTAVSDFNPAKFEAATQSAKKALGSAQTEAKKGVQVLSIEELVKAVQKIISEQRLEKQVDVKATGRGVVISAKGAAFFPSGEAHVLSHAMPLLQALAGPINSVSYSIAVEGHTDNVPLNSARYPSNWELSSARASEIVRYLASNGVKPQRLRATGLADTQPKAANTSERNRAMNRRIEIVFLTAP